MTYLVVEPHRLLEVGAVPTPEMLERVVGGLPQTISVRGPGFVRGYCDDSGVLKRSEPNILATLFYRAHGYMGDRCVIHGTVALTGGDGTGGYADVPAWVREELLALVPRAKDIDQAAGRPN
jgi:hypothetical protein